MRLVTGNGRVSKPARETRRRLEKQWIMQKSSKRLQQPNAQSSSCIPLEVSDKRVCAGDTLRAVGAIWCNVRKSRDLLQRRPGTKD